MDAFKQNHEMKPTQPYAQGYGYGEAGPPPGPPPYESERFKPKKRLRDPVFFVLFIAQVRAQPRYRKMC